MSIWLRKRLLLWGSASLLVAVLWSNGNVLYAQDAEGAEIERQYGTAPQLSRDEAAKWFAVLMEMFNERVQGTPIFMLNEGRMYASISMKSRRQLKSEENWLPLIQELAAEWSGPRKKNRVESEGNGTATVVVEDDTEPRVRPLVLVEENGVWGVDLLETYAKWNNLEGAAKAQAIFNLTGVELPGLPVTPEFLRAKENARRSACQSNLKQIGLGIAQYVQDYDEKMPLAKTWTNDIMPYVKSEVIFNCPALPKGQRYGYAYNAKLAKKDLFVFESTATVVSLYETSVLKRNAYGIGENSAFRHLDGANFGYLDGHVKWHPKNKAPSFNLGPTMKVSPSFAPPPY